MAIRNPSRYRCGAIPPHFAIVCMVAMLLLAVGCSGGGSATIAGLGQASLAKQTTGALTDLFAGKQEKFVALYPEFYRQKAREDLQRAMNELANPNRLPRCGDCGGTFQSIESALAHPSQSLFGAGQYIDVTVRYRTDRGVCETDFSFRELEQGFFLAGVPGGYSPTNGDNSYQCLGASATVYF